jgi:hypothetical protein
MIAEPYICIKGELQGEIKWYEVDETGPYRLGMNNLVMRPVGTWHPYAVFERDKLQELASADKRIRLNDTHYELRLPSRTYSWNLQGITTEALLLLTRAAFLQDVCEKEGVEWLPQDRIVAQVQVHDIPPEGIDIVHELTKDA